MGAREEFGADFDAQWSRLAAHAAYESIIAYHGKGVRQRCREVFLATQWLFEENIRLYEEEGYKISRLLVGEAPPWRETDYSYFYREMPGGRENSWRNLVLKGLGLPPSSLDTRRDPLENLSKPPYTGLRKYGFLLVDIFPFAFQFSELKKKSQFKKFYLDLVDVFLHHFLSHKLAHLGELGLWGSCVSVGYALKVPGQRVMNHHPDYMRRHGVPVCQEAVVATGSGFFTPASLSELFGKC